MVLVKNSEMHFKEASKHNYNNSLPLDPLILGAGLTVLTTSL